MRVFCQCGGDRVFAVMLGKDAQLKGDVASQPCDWCGGSMKTPRYFINRTPGEPEPEPAPAG